MEIYSVENLSFAYPNGKENALQNISFTVSEGEFITVCGLSGSGKSTLLRCLKTAIAPYGKKEGNIKYKGKPLEQTDELIQAGEIGFVMQSPDNQGITDSVWSELAFGLESMGLDNAEIHRRTAETAVFFGINDWYNEKISELSGGQKQILNLASVMTMNPSVLILDEPVSQLDPIGADRFMKLLRKINEEFGTTVIMSEHNLERVYGISNRIIVMSEGKVISDTKPGETADVLYCCKNEMFSALPISTQIYSIAERKCGNPPLTIGEGRVWLREYTQHTDTNEIIHKKYERDKRDVPVIELKNVWYRYEKGLPDILKGLSLKAYRGEIFSILGGNGAGKTTLLSTIAGVVRPYEGKILLDGTDRKKKNKDIPKMALLPQNPQTLFVRDTVEEDLYEILDNPENNKGFVEEIMSLCGLEELRHRHPYDLSGGERQRAAIAKLLLTRPDILLLDEPLKGLDIKSGNEVGEILRALAQTGVCIIIVSHDTEFSAEYSDRCALFFDGELTGTDEPHIFFSENTFYTTAARKMSRDIIDNAVTKTDILYALGLPQDRGKGKINKDNISSLYHMHNDSDKTTETHKKISPIAVSQLCAVILFIISVFAVLNPFKWSIAADNSVVCYAAMLISALCIILFAVVINKKEESIEIQRIRHKNRGIILPLIIMLTAVPLTIFVGMFFFNDSKYLFISLLIILECIAMFFGVFENRHIKTREQVLIAVMCALAVLSRTVFYMLPQFKPMMAIVIITGTALGAESGFLVGAVSVFISDIIFGQGPWTPWQMFSMGAAGFLAGILFGRKIIPRNRLSLSVYGFLAAVLIYGGIMNPASMLMAHMEPTAENLAAFYISGLPFDIVHAISVSLFLYITAKPFLKKLERVKLKYGLIVHRSC